MLSLTELVWDFQNNTLWDTRQHAQFILLKNFTGPKYRVFTCVKLAKFNACQLNITPKVKVKLKAIYI